MAESAIVRTKKDVTLSIQDDAAAETYAPTSNIGNFAFDTPLYDLVDIRNNGALTGVRQGDEQPATFSFGVNLTDVGSATELTLPDICTDSGHWAANAVSTTNQLSDVPTADVVVTVGGAAFGEPDKSVTFSDCVLRGSTSFEYPATYNVTGRTVASTKPVVA